MIQLVLVLIINTLILMGWGRLLKYLKVFKVNKDTEHQIFRFVMTGNIFSMILVFIIYPFLQTIIPDFTVSGFLSGSFQEVIKFIIFILLAVNIKTMMEPLDSVILSASLALGFALGENFIFSFNSGPSVFIYKSFFGLVGNITYSLIWGSILSVVFSTLEQSEKSTAAFYAIPALIVSILLHGTYNSLLFSGEHWYALIVVMLTLILFFTIYKYVKENSSYKKYPDNRYRSTVPGLQIGGR